MKAINNFAGLNGFVWWVGEVENRIDPIGLGRCQVRIFGWHTDDTSSIPTTDLPWAHPMWSINTGKQFQPLEIGDWVLGFFMDGESGQFPIMLGYLPGFAVSDSTSYANESASTTDADVPVIPDNTTTV
jgi:hypothetical protein